MRHTVRDGPDDATIQIGELRVDLTARRIFRGDQEIHLTPLEYKLLTAMIKHSERC